MAQEQSENQEGVLFAADAEGNRSTSAVGRAVVADALRPVDPAGAIAAQGETNWRSGYLTHFRRLVEAGLVSPEAPVEMARAGLASLGERMVVGGGVEDAPLSAWPETGTKLDGVEVVGNGQPVGELVLPYRGERLRGPGIRRRVDKWVEGGVVEPSVAEAVGEVLDNPDWLRLEGRTVVVLGAGSEMGPLPSLMRWGARVVAVDLDRPDIWKRVLPVVKDGAGTLLAPVPVGRDGALDETAGANLLTDVPAVERWLAELPGQLVLGNYVYADGGTNLRLSAAVDELTTRLQRSRDDLALAYLATPTDVFVVPKEDVEESTRSYEGRPARSKAHGSAVAGAQRWSAAASSVRPRVRPRHQRLADPAAGPELRAGQAGAPLAGDGRAGRRPAGVDEHRPAHPHQVGRPLPRPRRGVRRRPPVRRRGVRPVDLQRADGGAAGARPAHRRRADARTPLAGRGLRRRPRRAVDLGVRPAQRPRPGGRARVRRDARVSFSHLSHLECSRTGERLDADVVQGLSAVGAPLLARYDLDAVRASVTPEEIAARPHDLWRYHEVLPVRDPVHVTTLGEGMTPLLPLPTYGAGIGIPGLLMKDEGLIPTGTFKARGAAVGVSRARELGVRAVAMPTNGNAGAAWSMYAARAGMGSLVVMPVDAPEITRRECVAAGAELYLVDGLINHAGALVNAAVAERDGYQEVSTLKEPYRIEGKKTMGYEIVEQLGWELPDVILYPAGGGVGLIGIHKALLEMHELGWIDGPLPRLVAVQSTGCSPIVDAFDAGLAESTLVEGTHTIAFGINVPKALGDFLVLQAVRETAGTAVAVSDEDILAELRVLASAEGTWVCPEGAACFVAARRLREGGWIGEDERVVVLNTGVGLKYPQTVPADVPVLARDGRVPGAPYEGRAQQ